MILRKNIYKNILHKLNDAKYSCDTHKIKTSLLLLCDSIEKIIESDSGYTSFFPFVLDREMLFKTHRDILSKTGPDITVESTGLIAQMLDMINIRKYEELSYSLYSSICDVYSIFSIPRSGLEDRIEDLRGVIADFKDLLE